MKIVMNPFTRRHRLRYSKTSYGNKEQIKPIKEITKAQKKTFNYY